MNNLATSLNDHLAGSTTGRELAKRALSNNRGTQFETTLEWLVEQRQHGHGDAFEQLAGAGRRVRHDARHDRSRQGRSGRERSQRLELALVVGGIRVAGNGALQP